MGQQPSRVHLHGVRVRVDAGIAEAHVELAGAQRLDALVEVEELVERERRRVNRNRDAELVLQKDDAVVHRVPVLGQLDDVLGHQGLNGPGAPKMLREQRSFHLDVVGADQVEAEPRCRRVLAGLFAEFQHRRKRHLDV